MNNKLICFLFVFFMLFPSQVFSGVFDTPKCYSEAKYPAHEYAVDLFGIDFITEEKVVFLDSEGKECVESDLVLGIMSNDRTLYAPFKDVYRVVKTAFDEKNAEKMYFLKTNLRLPSLSITEYLDMVYKPSFDNSKITRTILAVLKEHTQPYLGSWKVYVPDEYLFPVLYLSLGGSVVEEKGEYYIRKPEDTKQPTGSNIKTIVYETEKNERLPGAWLLKWADINVQDDNQTGSWDNPIVVIDR